MPARTELVHLEPPVEIGMKIKVSDQWWFVESVTPPGVGADTRGMSQPPRHLELAQPGSVGWRTPSKPAAQRGLLIGCPNVAFV